MMPKVRERKSWKAMFSSRMKRQMKKREFLIDLIPTGLYPDAAWGLVSLVNAPSLQERLDTRSTTSAKYVSGKGRHAN